MIIRLARYRLAPGASGLLEAWMNDQPPDKADGAFGTAADLGVGSRVGAYRLVQLIGRGGMAAVFRANDDRLGRQAAVKILVPALAADEAFRQRFIRESRAAAAVDDPHIIPVYEAGQSDGVLFIAMRYVEGGDLRTVIRSRGALTPAAPRRYCRRWRQRWTPRTPLAWYTAM